jgi:hypothetical protein
LFSTGGGELGAGSPHVERAAVAGSSAVEEGLQRIDLGLVGETFGHELSCDLLDVQSSRSRCRSERSR